MNKFKLSLNILCILIIGVVACSTTIGLGSFTSGVIAGYEAAASVEEENLNSTLVNLSLTPKIHTVATPTDTITTADGKRVPVVITKGALSIPDSELSTAALIWQVVALLVTCIALILLIIAFIKFIFRINRGNIFDRRNIRLLFRIGIYLLIIVAADFIQAVIESDTVSSVIGDLKNYDISIWASFPWSTLILGLVAITLSAIWEIGLELKNDNELTI